MAAVNVAVERMRRTAQRRRAQRAAMRKAIRVVHAAPGPRPLLVGETNPYSADTRHALLPWPPQSAGARLRKILLMTDEEYLAAFERVNLLGSLQKWSAPLARGEAAKLRAAHTGPIVALGARVAAAFGLVLFGSDDKVVCVPHPSGLSRAWNERGVYDRVRRLVLPLVAEHVGGKRCAR